MVILRILKSRLHCLGWAMLLTSCGGGGTNAVTSESATPVGQIPAAGVSSPSMMGVYEGYFHNTSVNAGGTVRSSFDVSTTTSFSGVWNFTGDADLGITLCGAGPISFQLNGLIAAGGFTSNDVDQGCGFDHGSKFSLDAEVLNGGGALDGTYSVKNANGSAIAEGGGVFEVWRTGGTPVSVCSGTISRPEGTGSAGFQLPATMTGTFGRRLIQGRIDLPNVVQATGIAIDCHTMTSFIGSRDPQTGATEMRMTALNKTGTQCSGAASGSTLLRGSSTAAGHLTVTSVSLGSALPVTIDLMCRQR